MDIKIEHDRKEYPIKVGEKIYKASNDAAGVEAAKAFARSNNLGMGEVAIGRKEDGIYVIARVPLRCVTGFYKPINSDGQVFSVQFEKV